MSTSVIKCDSSDEVITKMCEIIERISRDSIEKRGSFKVGFSGGSLVSFLARGLPKISSEWDKWTIFFCDERLVGFDDPESTYGIYKEKLIGKVPLKEENFIVVNPNLTAEEAAEDYVEKMKKFFPSAELPVFDLLLLGMGPDGHTCSLFPGHRLLDEKRVWVAPITDSPKPPPSRITLTFPVINNARDCLFALTGDEKVNILKKILNGESFPAGMVKPTNGTVHWVIDRKI